MTDFQSMNLPANLVQALERMQITTPTPIQAKSIPLGLEGHDILASAQTGTGKTFSYLIPLLVKMTENPTSTALVLTPTRELATQVRDAVNQLLGRRNEYGLALIIGGEAISKQFDQLRSRPRLVIGTPGRVIDHLHRRTLNLMNTAFLVLDETDRMLDMGFHEQLKELYQFLPDERQTFMFSATMPDNIINLAKQYLNNPQRISIGSTTKPIAKIQQDIRHTTNAEKFPLLLKELDSREGSIIVFVKTKRGADELVLKLQHQNHSAEAIHGDLRQHKRDRVIREFRNKKKRIMVATDIAARGLDVPHVEHVVNYDLPQCPEDYIHRIGRTGRAGAEGNAITLVSPQEGRLWKVIHNLMNPGTPCHQPSGYDIPDPSRRRKGGRPANNAKPFGRSNASKARNEFSREGGFAERKSRNDRPREDAFDEPRGRDNRSRENSFGQNKSRDDRPREENFNSRRKPSAESRDFGRWKDESSNRRTRDERPREGRFEDRNPPSRYNEEKPRTSGFAARGPAARDRSNDRRENSFGSRTGSSRIGDKPRSATGKRENSRARPTQARGSGGNAPAFSRSTKRQGASKRA